MEEHRTQLKLEVKQFLETQIEYQVYEKFIDSTKDCADTGRDVAHIISGLMYLVLWPVTSQSFEETDLDALWCALEGDKFRVVQLSEFCLHPDDACPCWHKVPSTWEDRHEKFRKKVAKCRLGLMELECADMPGIGSEKVNRGADEVKSKDDEDVAEGGE
jgi:hypothetical protein